MPAPAQAVLDAIEAPSTKVLSRVDIYEEDGITEYLLDVGVIDGSISADYDRDERRSLDITMMDESGALEHDPGAFWYDKVLKVYRGVVDTTGADWFVQTGEFMVDGIATSHTDSHVMKVSGRDYAKKLINSKFLYSTLYPSTDSLEDAVEDIAFAAGVDSFDLPVTGIVLDVDVVFERETTRWDAIKRICLANGYEAYFKPNGELTISEFVDVSSPTVEYTFDVGTTGVMTSYDKKASDARVRNIVVVSGESTEIIPVTAVASNNVIGSPTGVEQIGERPEFITSPIITTEIQAQTLADKILSVSALEEYSVSFGSLVLPWLDVGVVVAIPPASTLSSFYGSNYLLSTLTFPIGLGEMSGSGKRIALL